MLTGLGIDEYSTRTDASGSQSFMTDALGSTVASGDFAGTVQTEYTYEPFGGTTATGVSSSNPFQYTGRENDSTGLYYYRARYYHPGIQRFISEDPIRFHGGDFNLFAYVGSNPVGFSDPLGLFHGSGEPPNFPLYPPDHTMTIPPGAPPIHCNFFTLQCTPEPPPPKKSKTEDPPLPREPDTPPEIDPNYGCNSFLDCITKDIQRNIERCGAFSCRAY
ncbi:MAG: RHS repeat-associated core domain-containing protein [Candidatus Binatia bacterium]